MTKHTKVLVLTLTLATGAFGIALQAQSGGMMGGGSGEGASGNMMQGGSMMGQGSGDMMGMMNMMAQIAPMMGQCTQMRRSTRAGTAGPHHHPKRRNNRRIPGADSGLIIDGSGAWALDIRPPKAWAGVPFVSIRSRTRV